MKADGSGILVGEADVIIILKLQATGRYHVCFAEYKPVPGQYEIAVKDLQFIRYKSGMHHTSGAATLAEAQRHVTEMRKKLEIADENVFQNEAIFVSDPVFSVVTPNWVSSTDRGNPFTHLLGPAVL